MARTPREQQADHKAAIIDECNRALKTLVAEPDLILPAAGKDPQHVYEALRKHGAQSDLLQIVRSWQDARDDQWVLNELRRWNTKDR